METESIKQEIDALILVLGDDPAIAKPAAERAVLNQIRTLLDRTRDQRTGASRELWEYYLPYAARLCFQLTKVEEGWEDELDYYASENAQFWLDNTAAFLEEGKIDDAQNGLGQITGAVRMLKRDMIMRMDILLHALDIALEISDKKRSIQLYDESEKIFRKHLSGSDQYAGSAWLPKIKKMGRQLELYGEKLRRYYQHADSVTISVDAASQHDLERVIEYLQQNLAGKVKITRRIKEANGQEKSSGYQARIKITLE